jgi:hypothetical protein
MYNLFKVFIFIFISSCFLFGCASAILRIPVQGKLNGQYIDTMVDSEYAQYYLEYHLQNQRLSSPLDSLFDEIHNQNKGSIPDSSYLYNLSNKYSVDFASLYLAKSIMEIEANRNIQSIYDGELAKIKASQDSPGKRKESIPDSSYLILFVPGWDYVESGPITGADFAKPRKLISELNIRNRLIDIDPNGSVEKNVNIVANEILRYHNTDNEIIVVSASSGGPTTAFALGSIIGPQYLSNVKAWINIGGILRGSPVVDHYLTWPRSWLLSMALLYKGWSIESIKSMSVEQSKKRFKSLDIPRHILIVNYIGIPLSGNISEFAEDNYQVLRQFGPNDGLTLITDGIAPNSMTIAELGVDHFFNEDPEIDFKTVALTKTILMMLDKQALTYYTD